MDKDQYRRGADDVHRRVDIQPVPLVRTIGEVALRDRNSRLKSGLFSVEQRAALHQDFRAKACPHGCYCMSDVAHTLYPSRTGSNEQGMPTSNASPCPPLHQNFASSCRPT